MVHKRENARKILFDFFPSLTVKFIKTPLKALFYLGFSAVPFRFTI